jgi:type I restriction enzyme M protein
MAKGLTGDRSNKYCASTDLTNEATVESFFMDRMLADLGYKDSEIKLKRSIDAVTVARGRKKESYKPDYLLVAGGQPRWLVDAKGTDENIEDYTYQGAGYALGVNRKFSDNPCRYYMLTNGLLTRVYEWDRQDAVLSLRFADFTEGNARYETLRRLLGSAAVRKGWEVPRPPAHGGLALRRPTIEEVKRAFLKCHQVIWKAEKISPQAAFLEFAKLLFVKLWEDRKLRDDPDTFVLISEGAVIPVERLRFSVAWIKANESTDPNPIADILFRQLAESLEEEIAQQKRKRIFNASERLNLAPGTVERVVAELEDYYLFGIDEDLNGRMFEAFLNATMRGKDLGQYFTPRSIVKLMTRLAQPVAKPGQVERIVDACVGTGGFLIEALTEQRGQIYSNKSLTLTERDKLLNEVANEAIFGIDAGREPAMARIARINMYLHGDGGSRIYMTDGLRSVPKESGADTVEVRHEVQELRDLLAPGSLFDVALTNPPFSMNYEMSVPDEREVLEDYELRTWDDGNRPVLRSSIMFIERYWQLLKPGGRLLTVIDDSILSSKSYSFVRDYIRARFIIRGIISLHGDAFQRAGARAKTSVLFVTKRVAEDEVQPDVFVYESRYIGLDDVVPRTRPSVATKAREDATQEQNEIAAAFHAYQSGERGDWLVSSDKLTDRLDAKYLRPWSVDSLTRKWARDGVQSVLLSALVEPVEHVVALAPKHEYTFLRISYRGYAEDGERALGEEVSYSSIMQAAAGDVVVSNISAVYRAICVMPDDLTHLLVSNEFTVLRTKAGVEVDPYYLWAILRTPGVIAEWLSESTGVGRHRVGWAMLSNQRVPLLPVSEQRKVGDHFRAALKRDQEAEALRGQAENIIGKLGLDAEAALERLAAAKPPR